MIQLTQDEHINPTILTCNMMTLYAPLILLGLPRNQHMHHLPTSDITRSSQDQIKLGINNIVVIITDHKELDLYPWFSHNITSIQQLGILDTTVIFLAIGTMTNTWSPMVIFSAITTNLSPQRTGVVIKHIIINTIDSRCDQHELGPYPRAALSIDLIYTL